MNKLPNKLLPVGFYDLLFDEAEKNHQNINIAVDEFLRLKYRLIKMPLVEFESSFSRNEMQNSFRAIDVISGENLVFRSDITPQISRLLSTRLQEEKLPLKLCYVGDVLCAKNNDFYKDRQQTQVGVEIIGCDKEQSNFEIIEILLKVLKKIKAEKNLVIEFFLPNFLEIFFAEFAVENPEELRLAIMDKNLSAIRKLDEKSSEIISKIMLSNHDLHHLLAEILEKIKSVKIDEEIKRAQKILDFVQSNFPEIRVCFDLFGDTRSSYHRDIGFDVFSGDFSYAIARGGRYKINGLDAVGATIYMNHLRKA